MEMSISEKIKAINTKIRQNKAKFDLDRKTANISALSPGNIIRYGFLPGKDVLPERGLPEKAATMKIFEYLPLCKELKAQNEIAKKQYKKLDKIYECVETMNKKSTLRKCSKSELICGANHSFTNSYIIIKRIDKLSLQSIYCFLTELFNDLDKRNKLNT